MGNTELIKKAKDLLYEMTYSVSQDAYEHFLNEAQDVIVDLVTALENTDKDLNEVVDTVSHLTEQINAFEEGLLIDSETRIPDHYTSIPHHYTSIPGEVRYVTTQTLPQEVQYNLHYIS